MTDTGQHSGWTPQVNPRPIGVCEPPSEVGPGRSMHHILLHLERGKREDQVLSDAFLLGDDQGDSWVTP